MVINSNIYIGTSGWDFDSWLGNFYNKKTNRKKLLEEYAEQFNSVELNSSFYRIPSKDNVHKWHSMTPDNFIFSCKASRYITHMKKLKNTSDNIKELFNILEFFEKKLGPILFQLPPRWRCDPERLEDFLKILPKSKQYVFEFRDHSWFCSEIYKLLEKYKAALCFYDYQNFQSPEIQTNDLIYLRLHGPNEKSYKGSYNSGMLKEYSRKILRWSKQARYIFCYFDNDEKSYAPLNALELKKYINK